MNEQDIDSKLRNAIHIAEERYDDPSILIVAHPKIASDLRLAMGAPANSTGVYINGYPIFESDKASLHALVIREGYTRNYDFDMAV